MKNKILGYRIEMMERKFRDYYGWRCVSDEDEVILNLNGITNNSGGYHAFLKICEKEFNLSTCITYHCLSGSSSNEIT